MVTRLRALGEPTRLRVVRELTTGNHRVCELLECLDIPGPLLSHHLGVLREVGLVTSQRTGRWVHYSLDNEALAATLEAVVPEMSEATR